MKKQLFIIVFLFCMINKTYSQQIFSNEKFDYESVGYILLFDYNKEKQKLDTTFKALSYKTRFLIAGDKPDLNKGESKLITVMDFEATKEKQTNKGSKEFINIEDNGKLFWIRTEELNKLLEKGYIRKRYYLAPKFAFGGSLSVPFKLRPETNDFNMKITPEVSLGGYVGLKLRLSRYNDVHLYMPVITLGITTIGINDNNILKENGSNTNVKDALVMGRTFTLGAIFEYNSFQMGFICGWDKAGGEIGKNWAYNNKVWYSFSIGYSFFGKESGK